MFQLLNHRMLFAWMLSVITSYFVVGFLGNYYPSFVGVLVLAAIAQTLLGVLIDRLFVKAERLYSSSKGDLFLALALFMVLTVFAAAMLQMANQFPSLFDAKFVLLEQDQTFPFIIAGVLTIPLLALAGQFMGQSRFLHLSIRSQRVCWLLPSFLRSILFSRSFSTSLFLIQTIFSLIRTAGCGAHASRQMLTKIITGVHCIRSCCW